jgi:hypothetical protein
MRWAHDAWPPLDRFDTITKAHETRREARAQRKYQFPGFAGVCFEGNVYAFLLRSGSCFPTPGV